MKVREQMLHVKERDAELECLAILETFDKGKLAIVIDRVLVYSEERIEIIWKMDDWFFKETAGEKEVLAV